MEGLTKKQMVAAIWNKFKDIIGNEDISKMGDGTVTGAITELNSNTLKMPDYSKRYVILNGNGTYSITKYGFVQLDCRNGDTNTNKALCRLFINGVQIDQTSGPPSADSKWVYYTSALYPVSPGDSVETTVASWSGINVTYFYPLL